LIEHYEGVFPAWLAPTQAAVLNITDKHSTYALEVEESLNNKGFRVISDLRNEKIGLKIRELSMQRVPYLLVVGDREQEQNTVAVRTRDGKDLGSMPIEAFAGKLTEEIVSRGRTALTE
jgi:threonyl-tRNA synthetase